MGQDGRMDSKSMLAKMSSLILQSNSLKQSEKPALLFFAVVLSCTPPKLSTSGKFSSKLPALLTSNLGFALETI